MYYLILKAKYRKLYSKYRHTVPHKMIPPPPSYYSFSIEYFQQDGYLNSNILSEIYTG